MSKITSGIYYKMASASGAHLEDIIKDIGGCGRFQIVLSTIVHSMKCIICFTMIFMIFGAAVPDWWCIDDLIGQNTSDVIGNSTLSQYKSCTADNATKPCTKFLFDDEIRTIVTKVFIIHFITLYLILDQSNNPTEQPTETFSCQRRCNIMSSSLMQANLNP